MPIDRPAYKQKNATVGQKGCGLYQLTYFCLPHYLLNNWLQKTSNLIFTFIAKRTNQKVKKLVRRASPRSSDLLFVVVRYSTRNSEDHYILRMFCKIFSITRFFDIFEPKLSKLIAWLLFQQNVCCRAFPNVAPYNKWGGKTPKFCHFPDRTATNLAPLFLNGEENQKSKTIMSITDNRSFRGRFLQKVTTPTVSKHWRKQKLKWKWTLERAYINVERMLMWHVRKRVLIEKLTSNWLKMILDSAFYIVLTN